MPIYEYVCPACKSKFELLCPSNESNGVAPCPRCHNEAGRVFSSFVSMSKGADGTSTSIGGGSACDTCSALSCATCQS
ncbi:MAG: zinc ribbon domain-containing protein [Dehalococcoidia bacterium]|nr:zinc ribbon domain-containing protein [Chloroflexota bacterium]MCK4221997.1 zinc ribbon domain-containing protein [Dehalococcoidia bacterium]